MWSLLQSFVFDIEGHIYRFQGLGHGYPWGAIIQPTIGTESHQRVYWMDWWMSRDLGPRRPHSWSRCFSWSALISVITMEGLFLQPQTPASCAQCWGKIQVFVLSQRLPQSLWEIAWKGWGVVIAAQSKPQMMEEVDDGQGPQPLIFQTDNSGR